MSDPQDPSGELESELDLEDEPLDPAGEPEGDQPDDVDSPADEPAIDAGPRPDQQPSRRDSRIQRLIEDNRRRDAENADLRRRLDELSSRRDAPPQARQESDEERAARYEAMSPGQAMATALREAEERFAKRMSVSAAQTQDIADKTRFQAIASSDNLYAKWADRVEAKLAELRSKGVNMDREVLFRYMIGEAALERRKSNGGRREVAEAGRRVAQRRSRPTDSGSDTSTTREERRGGGRDEIAARERRLANLQI